MVQTSEATGPYEVAHRDHVQAVAEKNMAWKHLQACGAGSCGACGQSIDPGHLKSAQEGYARLETAEKAFAVCLAELFAEMQDRNRAVRDQAKTLEFDLEDAMRRRVAIFETKRASDRYFVEHNVWEDRQAARTKQRETIETLWQEADDAVETALGVQKVEAQAVAELRVVTDVLGLRGVRAHVLGQALGGIEAVANIYLGRIAQKPMSLRLKSYTESDAGNVQDKISLEVEGAGGGYGYKASSGGERRRIDAALLLALAEVSSAASGREPGTLFFDEVFDAVDDGGVDAVVDCLVELAEERALVVITHKQDLAARIPAAKRVTVVDGRVV